MNPMRRITSVLTLDGGAESASYPADERLAGHVSACWSLVVREPPVRVRVIPDACIDIVRRASSAPRSCPELLLRCSVPVFRVDSVERSTERLAASGVLQLHKPMDIGEGKHVVTFRDPDGNAFRLIQIDD